MSLPENVALMSLTLKDWHFCSATSPSPLLTSKVGTERERERERERAVTRLAEIIKNGLEEKRERGVQGKKKRERGRDTRLAEIIKNGIEEKERGVTRLAEIM